MSKWPKVPFGSQSKFERKLEEEEKIIKPLEEPTQFGKGCSDPMCPMCYPGAAEKLGFSRGFGGRREEAMREIGPGSIVWVGVDGSEVAKPAPTPKDAKLKELRAEVEEFILTTPHDRGWDDFIGNDDAKNAMMQAIEASTTHKEVYDFYKMKPSKGVVLLGPPGCGKTMLGKLVAAALSRIHGKTAEIIVAKDLESPFVSVAESRVTAIFNYAREYYKVHGFQLVIFIDEAETLLPQRSSVAPWKDSLVNTFLAEMDGLEENGAFVILASNRPESIDEALMREGRCDRKIKVTRPGYEEAKLMIASGFKDVPLASELDVAEAVHHLVDYFVSPDRVVSKFQAINMVTEESKEVPLTLAHIMNGAMLTSLVERAKSFAFRRDVATGQLVGITMANLIAAVEEIITDNANVRHGYAITEIMEQLNLREVSDKKRKMN